MQHIDQNILVFQVITYSENPFLKKVVCLTNDLFPYIFCLLLKKLILKVYFLHRNLKHFHLLPFEG